MGHLQDMTPEQRRNFISMSYKRRLEANRGHNYSTWNNKLQEQLDNNIISVYDTTTAEYKAKDWVVELRAQGNYARIVTNYEGSQQRVRHYTVIYRPKKKK